jgi:DNA-binding response OmpR family regulator
VCELGTVIEPKTILVVEEDILEGLAVAEILMNKGFAVMPAANADEALKSVQAGDIPDLVITSVEISGSLSGLQLAAHIREALPALKTLVIFARLPRPLCRDVTELYLAKPYKPQNLLACVKYLLDTEPDNEDGCGPVG